MKKLIFLIVITITSIAGAKAQLYLGGSVEFWRNDNADMTTVSVLPEVGYNINNQWAVGTTLGFSYQKVTGLSNYSFGIAPYARYMFRMGIASLFVDQGFGIYKPKNHDLAFEIGLRPGLIVRLTDRFSLVGKFGFAGYQENYNVWGDKSKDYGLILSNNLSFGFYVSF